VLDRQSQNSLRNDHAWMSEITLLFQDRQFHVPRAFLCDFLENRGLLDATTHKVESSVPAEVFEVFAKWLRNETKLVVTNHNFCFLSLLAREFSLSALGLECATFAGGAFLSLSDRLSKVENEISTLTKTSCGFEQLKSTFDELHHTLSKTDVLVAGSLRSLLDLRTGTERLVGIDALSSVRFLKEVEFPMKEAASLDGVISYLAKIHGGNVHEKGIVTVTARSLADPKYGNLAAKYAADLVNPSTYFCSNGELHQWVCWDFHETRVRPTHYTLRTYWLKSWVLEGSLDGVDWTVIDQQTDTQDFTQRDVKAASFKVSEPRECRFIRLTQTANHTQTLCLQFWGVEFFGTLFESQWRR
jgi:hypothetical protein